MSNIPFSFPPPPPPPPKRTTEAEHGRPTEYGNGRGNYRGRGASSRGNSRGDRGSQPGGGFRGRANSFQNHNQYTTTHTDNNNFSRTPHSNSPQKRTYNTAFSSSNNSRPRPLAPPAVPSFNAPYAHLLPNKPATAPNSSTPAVPKANTTAKSQPKKNILGLTPAHPDDSSSEEDEDEDEEARLSTTITTASHAQGLSFTYNGQVASFRTAAEIQAWIAARRKNFPTVAKADAAKKAREEQKKKWEQEKAEKRQKWEAERAERRQKYEEEKKDKQIARQTTAKEKHTKGSDGSSGKLNNTSELVSGVDTTEKAAAQAERLRKKADKAERLLRKAEEALRVAKEKQARALARSNANTNNTTGDKPDISQPDSTTQDIEVDLDETSSSGTDSDSDDDHTDNSGSASDSESDADSAPETTSTKDPLLARLPPISDSSKRVQTPRLCKNLLRTGHCSYGSNCLYSHDSNAIQRHKESLQTKTGTKARNSKTTTLKQPERRKGLFQVMVEQEEEEQRKRVVEAIFAMRERGMLDEPGRNEPGPNATSSTSILLDKPPE